MKTFRETKQRRSYSIPLRGIYFEHNGKLTCTEDKNHNKTRYLYKAGVLQCIEYPGGQYFDVNLENGKIMEIKDILGRKLFYEYEECIFYEEKEFEEMIQTFKNKNPRIFDLNSDCKSTKDSVK